MEEAALELYTERGFDETTVAEIAERAGLTERTFFRYFTDKREVLFGGQDALLDIFVSRIADAPGGDVPDRRRRRRVGGRGPGVSTAVTSRLGGDRPSSPPTPACKSAN
jgi:AcrR family transcriptional regulator